MNPAIATVIGAVVGGAVAIAVAMINAAVGRGGRRADIADKVSQAWDPVFERYDKDMERLGEKCDKCETRLQKMGTDFSAFADVVEELVPLLPPGDPQRKARVAINAARMAH